MALLREIKDLPLDQVPEFQIPNILLPLDHYQRQAVMFGSVLDRWCLSDKVGLGKTIQALATFANRRALGLNKHLLIVTESTATHATWAAALNRQTDFQFIMLVDGQNPRQRRMTYRTQLNERRPIIVMNWELFAKDYKELMLLRMLDMTIFDETARIKNPESKTREMVRQYQFGCPTIMYTNGTLAETNPLDIYSQIDCLYPGILGTKQDVINRHCYVDMVPVIRQNEKTFEEKIGAGGRNMQELRSKIDWMILERVPHEVGIKYPESKVIPVELPFTPLQDEVYDQLHRGLLESLDEVRKVSFGVKFMYKLMCCDSPCLVSKKDYVQGESAKIDFCLAFVKKALARPEKVIIFSKFRKVIMLLEQVFRYHGINCATITGREKSKELRGRIKDSFNNPHSGLDLLLVNTAAIRAIDLDGARLLIRFDQSFNEAVNNQMAGRLTRRTSIFDGVFVYDLTIADSAEVYVKRIRETRRKMSADFGQKETTEHISWMDMKRAMLEEEAERHARAVARAAGQGDARAHGQSGQNLPYPDLDLLLPPEVRESVMPGL